MSIRHLSLPLLASVSAIAGCPQPTSSSKTPALAVAVVTDPANSVGVIATNKSANAMLTVFGNKTSTGTLQGVRGAHFTDGTDNTVTVWAGDDGLPRTAVIAGVTYIFQNYGSDNVDVTAVRSDGTYETRSQVPVDSATLSSLRAVAAPSTQKRRALAQSSKWESRAQEFADPWSERVSIAWKLSDIALCMNSFWFDPGLVGCEHLAESLFTDFVTIPGLVQTEDPSQALQSMQSMVITQDENTASNAQAIYAHAAVTTGSGASGGGSAGASVATGSGGGTTVAAGTTPAGNGVSGSTVSAGAGASDNGDPPHTQAPVLLKSGGSGSCGVTDSGTLVTSASASTPVPALISGGNTAPQCTCGNSEFPGDPAVLPVTTPSKSDTWGDFTISFTLPPGYTNPQLQIAIRADDGAQIYLNDTLIDQVDLPVQTGATQTVTEASAQLFREGANTLRIYVVNTGSGHFGAPRPRGGPGDCMYLEYSGQVTYER